MTFATQKLHQRQTKDMVFFVRNQQFTYRDIEHYWRRKSQNSIIYDETPKTPEGLTYRTLSPSPRSYHSLYNEIELDASDLPLTIRPLRLSRASAIPHFRRSVSRLSSPVAISAPEPLRIKHKALHYAGAYIRACIEHQRSKLYLGSLAQSYNALWDFRAQSFNAISTIQDGLSHETVEISRSSALEMVPEIMRVDRPMLMAFLLDIVAQSSLFAVRSENRNSQIQIRKTRNKLVACIIDAAPPTHPLVLVLKAASWCSDNLSVLSIALMHASVDILRRELGDEDRDGFQMLNCCCVVASRSGDLNTALRYAKERHQIASSVHKSTTNNETLRTILHAQYQLAGYHRELEEYEIAEDLVEDGLLRCNDIQSSFDRHNFRADFLFVRGRIAHFRGDLAKAKQSFEEALQLRLRSNGAGHYQTSNAVSWLKKCVREQELQEQNRVLEAAEQEDGWDTDEVGAAEEGELEIGEVYKDLDGEVEVEPDAVETTQAGADFDMELRQMEQSDWI